MAALFRVSSFWLRVLKFETRNPQPETSAYETRTASDGQRRNPQLQQQCSWI